MIVFKRLNLAAAICVCVAASTFAEQRPQRSTTDAVRAAGAMVRSVTLRELKELLRSRSSVRPQRKESISRRRESESLVMPVQGTTWKELRDSFGDARAGGRQHMGIDIFAPRWTEVLAATSGRLAAIDHGQRSGRSLWLVGNDGRSYFYAHLQNWADGIHEGMRVSAGELIGFVGNTGNASGSPPHLHFEIRDRGRGINPYPVLADARTLREPAYASSASSSRRRGR